MQKMSTVKCAIITAVCIALCVVLPMAFHAIPNGGTLFSPMHLPALLAGLLCGWSYGLLCGLAGPLVSSLITGMPPLAYLPSMMIELAAYGLVNGLMFRLVRTKKLSADLYISLVVALLAGRIVAGLARALIFAPGKYTFAAWFTGYFVKTWPAMVIQLTLIPALIVALMKAKLIPERYPARD